MVFRVQKNKNYTVMSNYHLRDKNLSLKAKGLLSWMLSNDDDWDYSIAGIVACCKEGETTVNTALRELQKYGYVHITKVKPNADNNRIHYVYDVYEKPTAKLLEEMWDEPIEVAVQDMLNEQSQDIESQDIESQGVENQVLESQDIENQVQRNTEIRNTNKRNTKEEKSISKDIDRDFSFGSKESTVTNNTQWFIDKYHEICVSLPKIRTVTDKRKKAIQKIMKKFTKEDIIECFNLSEQSDFLKGNNDRGWKADIDFILREDKFVAILEGKYGGKKRTKSVARDIEKMKEVKHMSDEEKVRVKERIANGTIEKF